MENAAILIELLLRVTAQAQAFAALLAKSRAEGRDVTDEELRGLLAADDAKRTELETLIASKS